MNEDEPEIVQCLSSMHPPQDLQLQRQQQWAVFIDSKGNMYFQCQYDVNCFVRIPERGEVDENTNKRK